MDEFVDQTKTLVGALGWDLFREMRGRLTEPTTNTDARSTPPSSELRFFFRGDGFAAEMALGASGDFVVLAGSKARVRETSSIPRATKALRQTLLESGVLRLEGAFLIFTSDYSFSSASAAAAAVIGASANGRILWKLPDGRIYADWESGQGSSPETGTTTPVSTTRLMIRTPTPCWRATSRARTLNRDRCTIVPIAGRDRGWGDVPPSGSSDSPPFIDSVNPQNRPGHAPRSRRLAFPA